MHCCPNLKELPFPPEGRKKGWPWTEETTQSSEMMSNGNPWPKISIVTPSYNQGKFIEETIRSVLLQRYPNLEYIIIDGGSTDNSVDIIKKYGKYLRYWTSEPDQGQANAINKGFSKASGDILGFLNSDDLFTPKTLFKVAEQFRSCIHLPIFITFSGSSFDSNLCEIVYKAPENPSIVKLILTASSFFQPSTFWTRALHKKVGNFREDFKFCFDKEFFVRALSLKAIYRGCPEFVASKFRIHPCSKTTDILSVRNMENEKICNMYLKNKRIRAMFMRAKSHKNAIEKINTSLEIDGFIPAFKVLLEVFFLYPRIVLSRFYLGALKRLIYKSFEFYDKRY
ncbi:MAG: glycosyltransferase family 2 protein [Candidatus Omnitrophota bacterium]|nr:glycosyltransferase family 2 protein [Candidatus Omnitrophota bacterium]